MSQKPTAEKLPPYSVEAEGAMLGCIILSPVDCLGECMEAGVTVNWLYDLRHRCLFDTMLEFYEDNEAFDLITLTQKLKNAGNLENVGGLAYFSALSDNVPSAANIAHYIAIVREKFLLRSMIAACAEITRRAYIHDGNVDEFLDEAESSIHSIADVRGSRGHRPMVELVNIAIDQVQKFHEQKGQITALTTGIIDLDKMTWGLKPSDMVVIAARPSVGKAQPVSEPILTPSGFKPMGEIQVGDFVIGANGLPTRVLNVFPQGPKPIFEVTMSDGSTTRCTEDHLWFTQTRNERRHRREPNCGSVKTLGQIIASIHRPDGGNRNHALPAYKPVQFISGAIDLPMNPWLLGALIGDGAMANKNSIIFTKPEPDILSRVATSLPEGDIAMPLFRKGRIDGLRIKRAKRTNAPSETLKILKSLGLLGCYSDQKFIPREYLFAPESQRWELLNGLIDTDGTVTSQSIVEYSTSSERLALNVLFLARGLGLTVLFKNRIPVYAYKGKKLNGLMNWRLYIRGDWKMVSSEKHKSKIGGRHRRFHRSILSVAPCGMEECQCIRVEAADGLYLTSGFIPTHNSSLAMQIAEHVAVERKEPVGVFSLEMTDDQLVLRMLCSHSRVNLRNIRDGFMAERDFPKLTGSAGKLAKAPIYIDDSPGLSILQLRAKARRMVQLYGIKLIVIDYLQLVSSHRKHENRNQEVTYISGQIKQMLRELHIPGIVLSQLNRDLDKRGPESKPKLSDLRESGAIEQDADLVGLLYRKPQKEGDANANADAILTGLDVAKQRNGPTGLIELLFTPSITRFGAVAKVSTEDMPK